MDLNMQSRVSIVIPCYNKVNFVGATLDSILAQKWDNIELILVNDGSTDGTRDVVVNYETKFKVRGYSIRIIDQKNGGCCKAAHTGLLNMTGDYFCLVDADDEIEPEYVSTMADWLDNHTDYEWTACSYRAYLKTEQGEKPLPVTSSLSLEDNKKYMLECHIMRREITTSWIYMSRIGYLNRCGLIENFCTERRATYEPLFAVPLMLGGGKLKCFEEALYKFNRFASDLYHFNKYDVIEKYYGDYSYLYNWAIERFPVAEDEKIRLKTIVELFNKKDQLYHLNNMDSVNIKVEDGEEHINSVAEQTARLIDKLFTPAPNFNAKSFIGSEYCSIFNAIELIILGIPPFPKLDIGKVIAYGVLGKRGKQLLGELIGTLYEPQLLWDIAATDSSKEFGKQITLPQFDILNNDDIIIVFPQSGKIAEYVKSHCNAAILSGVSINKLIEYNKIFPKNNCIFAKGVP